METLNLSSIHPTEFIKHSVLWGRQGLARGHAWFLPSGGHQTWGTSEPVSLRAHGLWEHRGGAVRSEAALRLRGELTRSTAHP